MKLAQRLVSHVILPRTMIAGMLLATLGMACVGGQDAPERDDGERVPRPATAREEGRADPGFSDDHVLFGQSAAFTGPARELGIAMRLGIEAAFHEANREGGVHGPGTEARGAG